MYSYSVQQTEILKVSVPYRAAINKGGKHARLNFPLEDYAAELDDLLSALLVLCGRFLSA